MERETSHRKRDRTALEITADDASESVPEPESRADNIKSAVRSAIRDRSAQSQKVTARRGGRAPDSVRGAVKRRRVIERDTETKPPVSDVPVVSGETPIDLGKEAPAGSEQTVQVDSEKTAKPEDCGTQPRSETEPRFAGRHDFRKENTPTPSRPKRGTAYSERFMEPQSDALTESREISTDSAGTSIPPEIPRYENAPTETPPQELEQRREPERTNPQDTPASGRDSGLKQEHTPRLITDRPGRLQFSGAGKTAPGVTRKRRNMTDSGAVSGLNSDAAKPELEVSPSADTEKMPPAAESALSFSADETTPKPLVSADEEEAFNLSTPAFASEATEAEKSTHNGNRQPAEEPRPRSQKPSKLRFSQDETAPTAEATQSTGEVPQSAGETSEPVENPESDKEDSAPNKKLEKTRSRAELSAEKLEAAKRKLPKKRSLKLEKTVDEQSGKPKRKLRFETEFKSQREHLKGPIVTRPVKFGANAAVAYAHSKIYRVEDENVGTKAAHRAEILVEGAARMAYRRRKTAPYRKVERLTRKTTKLNIKADYQQVLADNPKLQSNVFSRMAQKRKIKRDYAKAAREAKKAANRAKKTGDFIGKAAQGVVHAIAKHPAVFGVIAGLGLMIILISALFTSCSNMASGIGSMAATGSYLASDTDIDAAELAYTQWETALQLQIGGTEADYPGFNEYRYNIGDISHNPYELLAYLTARYQDFTFAGIEYDLQALFAEQYQLSFVESIETRYADPDDMNGDGDLEPYEWRVLTVKLTAEPFADIALPHLDSEQRRHYDLLMRTGGSRQYAGNPFDFGWLGRIMDNYGWRLNPSGAAEYQKGAEISAPAGSEVRAGHDGVISVGYDSGGFGHFVTITGANGLVSKYARLEAVLVSNGQSVKKGDVIAKTGAYGLRLEIMKNGAYLNPLLFAETGGFAAPVYGDPGAPMGDGSYAALIAEAEKYLGFPYVWSGSSPATSFDCSGYVSYVLRASGVRDVGRQTAQGLYNLCTPVAEPQPGDLVFFHSTYSSVNPVTHVGIFVGGPQNLMLHCGNPICYTTLNTSYWHSHLYAYGRIQN